MSSAAVPLSCSCASDGTPGVSWWRILVGAFLAVNSMALAIAVNTSDTDQVERGVLQGATLAVTAVVTVLLGWPLAISAYAALRDWRITIEALFLVSYMGAVGASFLSMVNGRGPVFWEVAAILLVVYSLGRAVGRYSQQRILKALAAFDPHTSECERVCADGSIETVSIAAIRSGDVVRVHPGFSIPVDGTIHSGKAFIREAAMTGEAFSVSRCKGDPVFAGTTVLDASVDIRASAAGTDRQVDRISAALEAFRLRPAPSQIIADRMMRWFVPILLVIAAGTFAFWYSHSGFATALFNSMAVLLVACPCALGFATPVAVWSGMGRLEAIGFLAKDGAVIEKLAMIDTLVFDKTGTLTVSGRYRAQLKMLAGSPVSEEQLRTLITCAESRSQHPLALSLRELGEEDPRTRVERMEIIAGVGMRARLVPAGGKAIELTIGVAGVLHPEPLQRDDATHHIVVIADGTPAAIVELEEEAAPAIDEAVRTLEQQGLHCMLMTGDAAPRAARIPIEDCHSGLSPDDKLLLCRGLARDHRSFAFIGDGLNDAAAMSVGDVGIAVDSGAPLAQEVADIVWSRFDLSNLPRAVAICRDTVRSIRTTVAIALAYNVVGIVLAAGGMLHPVVASILMTCSSLVVTWRSVSTP